MKIHQNIRDFIKSKGLTFTFVSEVSGIDMKKLSRMMTGNQKIDTDSYEKICLALEVDPGYFFTKKVLESKSANESNTA